MEVKRETDSLSNIKADILLVFVFQDEKLDALLKELDPAFPDDYASDVAAECLRENFTGKASQSVVLPTFGAIAATKLVIKGAGNKNDVGAESLRKASASTARRLSHGTTIDTTVMHTRLAGRKDVITALIEGWLLGSYQFKKYKTVHEETKAGQTKTLCLVDPHISEADFQQATSEAIAVSEATNMARDMVAEPPAFMTPHRLARTAAEQVTEELTCQIIDRAEAESRGMGAFLGVARGATEPPKFIIMRYRHPEAKKTIAIAGKGITFDSGGLSMKTALAMEHMKYDMTGAAVVISVMSALAKLKPKINVNAVAAATENMPGPNAMHPGDIVVAMNGKTIEVNNTDAEGRLVLADALSFLTSEKPDEVIDLATLTGAVVTALGRAAAGIMGNNDALIERLIASGARAGEKFWRLPLYDEYKEALKSDVADLKNAGARGEAGSPAAGMFLKEFVNGRPWAHLDIAGPAWMDKEKDEMNKGGTAFGVRTICYYILSQAQ